MSSFAGLSFARNVRSLPLKSYKNSSNNTLNRLSKRRLLDGDNSVAEIYPSAWNEQRFNRYYKFSEQVKYQNPQSVTAAVVWFGAFVYTWYVIGSNYDWNYGYRFQYQKQRFDRWWHKEREERRLLTRYMLRERYSSLWNSFVSDKEDKIAKQTYDYPTRREWRENVSLFNVNKKRKELGLKPLKGIYHDWSVRKGEEFAVKKEAHDFANSEPWLDRQNWWPWANTDGYQKPTNVSMLLPIEEEE